MQNFRLFHSIASAAIVFTSANATAQSTPGNGACPIDQNNAPTLEHLRFGAIEGVKAPNHGVVEELTTTGGNAGRSLGYTRLRVTFMPCPGFQREYSDERRNGVKRYFFGKNAEKSIELRFKIAPPNVDKTMILAKFERHSTKKGEVWSTAIENDRIPLPYMRADIGSTVSISASIKSSRTYESKAVGGTLEIIQNAAALISPAAPLLTKENKERHNTAASFIDNAVNALLGVSIAEAVVTDVSIDPRSEGKVLAVLTAFLPMANNTFAKIGHPNRPIGQWIIFAERLQPSILGTVSGDRLDRASTTPAAVLNFLIDEKKTLRETLEASKSVGAARNALISAESGIPDKARAMCRAVTAEAEGQYLTSIDGGAAAWAYLTDLALPGKKMIAAEAGCVDVDRYPRPVASD